MSNPLMSLKKKKKPPLYLPGMPQLSPASSQPSPFNLHNPHNNLLSPIDTFNENNSPTARSSISSYNTGFSNRSNLNKKLLLNESSLSSRVPFKSKIDDSDLIDEYTTKMAADNLKKNLASTKIDMDLMQIMMSKIKATEAKCAFLERTNREKDKKISILEEKLNIYKKKADETNRNELLEELEKKNRQLKSQIEEMENFLADYGLKWIGEHLSNEDLEDDEDDYCEDSDNQSLISRADNDHQSKFTYANKFYYPDNNAENSKKSYFECNYDKMISNINELNLLTDHNEPKIVNFNNGAKFETADSINLTLYSNGICLFNGPFRSFEESLTRKFCIDICDGYFPSELQTKYPDGVSFNLIDKRDICFQEKQENSVFKSKGYRLGSTGAHSARYRTEAKNFLNKKIESQLNENPITVEQFLNKLPSSVIRNGKIIDIKSDLKLLIKNDSQSQTISIIDKTSNNESSIKNSENVATLRVKSLTNDRVNFMLKMNYTDTIQHLKDIIKSQRQINGMPIDDDFDLATMYPRKILAELDLTLEQCELVPQSNVLIMPCK